MRKSGNTYIALLLSTFIISQLTGPAASAASSVPTSGLLKIAAAVPASTTSTASNLGSVVLGPNIKATLEDVNLWPQSGGNILTYTLNYSNGSGGNANLIQYFPRVAVPGGTVIAANPITSDALKKKVTPKGNLRVTYYVNVGKLNSLKGVKFPMYVWDTKTKGYLKHAGSFNLPANYSPVTPIGKSQTTAMGDIPVAAGAESLQLYKYEGKVYAKIGLNLTNKGNKVLSDPGYAAYLVTASGTAFELALDSAQAGYKIQPQEKKLIYYLTEIPPYLKTDNMKLQFTQKDATLKVELPKSAFKLPAATTPNLVVGRGVVKKIMINNNTIETLLSNANVYAENDKGIWTFQLRVKNTGNKAVTLPTYELSVKSAKGKTFPIDAKSLNGITIKPLEEKVIPLSAQLPLEVEQNTLQLLMIEAFSAGQSQPQSQPDPGAPTPEANAGGNAGGGTGDTPVIPGATAKLSIPVAYFSIPYSLRADTQKGLDYTATTPYGTFTYSLESLQRFPWKAEDIVVAKVKLTNTQSAALSLPEIKGGIKADNSDFTASTELFMDKETATLAPGKTADVFLMTKIPYTQDFSTLKLNLFSVIKEENVPILTLSTTSMMNAVEQIEQGGSYSISSTGKNAKVKESKTTIYEGQNANIVYTEMLLSSEEKRQSKMARLQAYYKMADGQIYEATSNQPETAATPGGQQLISFWAKLPKSVGTSDASLYLGPGVTGNKLTETGQEPSGFINIASLALNPVVTPPQKDLSAVKLNPYTLSVQQSEGRNLKGSDTISISMNYNLLRDSSYEMGAFNHKLVLKMTDPYGQSQEKSLALGTELTEGNNNSYAVSFSSNMYKNLAGGTYRITLYDEFQGERIELASQAYNLTIERVQTNDKN
ncbi:hypothetical protein J7E73_17300 [Paenibacillus albidus]|uniref:hypothetical protein n=1 Tax=Paenibacillus albidus TaxID=2041023 RepID=UPI001BEC33C9|nr:hypothetical protein [Paenibacillus albidus]MBT2290858.1 hypothetical protein [Paenibacillus albidus]